MKRISRVSRIALVLGTILAVAVAGESRAAVRLHPTHSVLVVGEASSASRAAIARAGSFWRAASHGRVRMTFAYSRSRLPDACATDRPQEAVARGVARGRILVVIASLPCLPGSTMTVTESGVKLVVMNPALLASGPAGDQTMAHELGHALGFAHSHSGILTAPGEQPGYVSEYGDSWSVMGGGGLSDPPAPMQYALRWIRYRPIARGQTLPLALLRTGDALVFERGLGSRLWIERRNDANGVGVLLHLQQGATEYVQSWLITPLPLSPGQTWTDPFTGATIVVGVGEIAVV